MKAWQEYIRSSVFLLREHWTIVLLACIAAFPLFADLGGDYLWADEGDTAVLAQSILKYGVPKAWDGVTFIDSDFGDRLNDDLVMVSHPWLQYYITAASFFLFGESTLAARFPFALAGLICIPLLYTLVIRLTSDRRAALSAALLLTLSVQFLLFSRQCRNYSLNMLLTLVMILLFMRLNRPRGWIPFAFTAILLFHCNPSGVAPLGALGLLTLVHPPFAQLRKGFWMAFACFAVFVVPWLFVAATGYQQNTSMLTDWNKLAPRLAQFLIECASVTPVVGVIGLFLVLWVRKAREVWGRNRELSGKQARQIAESLLEPGERNLVLIAGMTFVSYSMLVALTQSRAEIWNVGLRHCTPIIALVMAVIGIMVSKVALSRRSVWVALMLILCVTKFGRITPLSFLHEERTVFDNSVFAAMHVPKGWVAKIFRVGLISFSRELWHENRGTVAHLSEYLSTNAAPGDVVITNYDWEPLYFHTKLPQGLKVLPNFRIFETARRKGLPDYVFTVDSARWLIWRSAWEGYRDFEVKEVVAALEYSGATVTRVASVPETAWENRANIHFRRFPGPTYHYPFYENLMDAHIFRIDWPNRSEVPVRTGSS